MKKKRPITLLEIMIVIFLIGLIGSVIGYNMKGSMDKGKAFKTEHAMRQIEDILVLQVDDENPVEKVAADPIPYLTKSGMVKDPDKLMKDGWGGPIVLSVESQEIKAYSKGLEDYEKKLKKAASKK